MYTSSLLSVSILLGLLSGSVLAIPTIHFENINLSDSSHELVSSSSSEKAISFNNYDGLSSMSNFDGFYGSGNFDGSSNQIIVEQQEEVVCHSVEIEIVQQKLVILQEIAKRIITEQICEVEVQTIVLEQFSSNFDSFSNDLSRSSGRQIGYDSNVASLLGKVVNPNGSLSSSNLGFSGQSVGSHLVVPQGSNWNSQSSPAKVASAKQAAISAAAQ